jgi:hypothetical protein
VPSDWDEERISNYFETALRDLQIEGIPLLGCDADQVHTLQAALWTTMAELLDQPEANKACMILEQIPVAALKTFVDDFLILKNQIDQIANLPELHRLTISLVAKGIGPAVLVEVTADDDWKPSSTYSSVDEFKYSAAMKAFMERVVIGSSNDPATIGLGDEGSAQPILYRTSFSKNVCSVVATFWNCICEMQLSPDVGTICLIMPFVDDSLHDRFVSVAQLLGRSLCLYQGDSVFTLVHFHPNYNRSLIPPVDQPAFGHIPPIGWLRPMLSAHGDEIPIDDASLQKSNYQRRSPVMAVNVVRNDLLADPTIVEIKLDSGKLVQASGLEIYCPNAVLLASMDESVLVSALGAEKSILF